MKKLPKNFWLYRRGEIGRPLGNDYNKYYVVSEVGNAFWRQRQFDFKIKFSPILNGYKILSGKYNINFLDAVKDIWLKSDVLHSAYHWSNKIYTGLPLVI